MELLHDEENGPAEPLRGLPGPLPEGEQIVWQSSPNPWGLVIHAFHVRFALAYVALLALWNLIATTVVANGAAFSSGKLVTLLFGGAIAIGLISLIGVSMARAAVFTVTTRRVIIRHGLAIPKYINLPFTEIKAVSIANHRKYADIAFDLTKPKIPYIHLWPFARPLRFRKPVPLLRSLATADAHKASAAIIDQMQRNAPKNVQLTETNPVREEPISIAEPTPTAAAHIPANAI
ncbi:MAG: photosynthetic complex putative assembly protein PuhB [Pseudomonadota bacterium]